MTCNVILGCVISNASAIFMARVVDSYGNTITQSDIASVKYTVHEIDRRTGEMTALEGHKEVPLNVADVIFDTLQTGGLWDADATGYNFRHQIDVSNNQAFPERGHRYQVRFQLTPTSGQVIPVVFEVEAIA